MFTPRSAPRSDDLHLRSYSWKNFTPCTSLPCARLPCPPATPRCISSAFERQRLVLHSTPPYMPSIQQHNRQFFSFIVIDPMQRDVSGGALVREAFPLSVSALSSRKFLLLLSRLERVIHPSTIQRPVPFGPSPIYRPHSECWTCLVSSLTRRMAGTRCNFTHRQVISRVLGIIAYGTPHCSRVKTPQARSNRVVGSGSGIFIENGNATELRLRR